MRCEAEKTYGLTWGKWMTMGGGAWSIFGNAYDRVCFKLMKIKLVKTELEKSQTDMSKQS